MQVKSFYLKVLLGLGLFLGSDLSSAEAQIVVANPITPTSMIKIESIVDDVLSKPLNTANVERFLTKGSTDLLTAVTACLSFFLAHQGVPKLLGIDPASQVAKGLQLPVAAVASLLSLRITRSAFELIFKFLSWDPRDLAIANALLKAMQDGATLTSDCAPLQGLMSELISNNNIITKGRNGKNTRSWLCWSRKAKVALSQKIRSCLHAFKHQLKK